MKLFIIYNITLLSSAFSIGSVTTLLLRYKTKTSYNILLFLISLLFISTGFYINVITPLFNFIDSENTDIIRLLIHLIGAGLNIWILPYLVTSLTNRHFPTNLKKIFGLWTGLFVMCALLSFSVTDSKFLQSVLTIMQVLSIFAALLFIGLNLKKLKKIWWYKSLKSFLIISSIFLISLIMDMVITIYDIRILKFLDNLSLPFYLLFINIGITIFSVKFLSKTVMIDRGKLTEDCIEYYGLSPREIEVIETLSNGETNKNIAEKLFISTKTVENHLTSIYRKINVRNRTQLIQVLNSWSWV